MNPVPPSHDPFKDKREEEGVLKSNFNGEEITMILGLKDVRAAANDWKKFSSDAPFRVPIPSEEHYRTVRQLPIETDPPDHTEFRKIVEPFFLQAKTPEMIEKIEGLISQYLSQVISHDTFEAVGEFALPIQSIALTYLLRVPESEANLWISWGTNIFKDEHGNPKALPIEDYIHKQINRAQKEPGNDFFSVMLNTKFRDRFLTREEIVGYANLAFAGGRDTVIQTIIGILHYFSTHPNALNEIRQKPELIPTATEEFFRYLSPITHIGRVCKHATDVKESTVEPDHRISLCWASANKDSSIFNNPDEVMLDRKPNPHVAFGSGPHNCLGAHHARLIVKTLIKKLCERVEEIQMKDFEPHLEKEKDYTRHNGFDRLTLKLIPLKI